MAYALTMPRVRPLAKAAMTTLGGGARATVATYRLALPMKLKIMLPMNSASSAVVTCRRNRRLMLIAGASQKLVRFGEGNAETSK